MNDNAQDGTTTIAEHFDMLAHGAVCFEPPQDAVSGWLPNGYRMVTDPDHLVQSTDCILPFLGIDWRLVSSINGSLRTGRRAAELGDDIHYLATLDILTNNKVRIQTIKIDPRQ